MTETDSIIRSNKRREPAIPRALRKEISEHCRAIRKTYAKLFKSDPKLKERIARLTRALLPPRPRRPGRRPDPEISRMIAAYRKLRREHPEITPKDAWHQTALGLVLGYADMGPLEQSDVREDLKAKMKSRLRKRRRRTRTKQTLNTE